MRLEITRRSDLATRALLELARTGTNEGLRPGRPGGDDARLPVPGDDPAGRQGWVRSDPGPTGGYTVLVDPAAVTVLEVIEAVEGPTDTGRCVLEDRPCADGGLCAAAPALVGRTGSAPGRARPHAPVLPSRPETVVTVGGRRRGSGRAPSAAAGRRPPVRARRLGPDPRAGTARPPGRPERRRASASRSPPRGPSWPGRP